MCTRQALEIKHYFQTLLKLSYKTLFPVDHSNGFKGCDWIKKKKNVYKSFVFSTHAIKQ